MMLLNCVPYILYWIQAQWKSYVQTYFQIIWVIFTNMVAMIFFPSGGLHLVNHPLSLSAFVHFCLTPPPPPNVRTSFMDGPFHNILLLKEFLAFNGCFGLFTKIKKWSCTSFWSIYPALFFHKNVPYLILYQWTKFQRHTFFHSQVIKPNILLSSYLDSWWCHKL